MCRQKHLKEILLMCKELYPKMQVEDFVQIVDTNLLKKIDSFVEKKDLAIIAIDGNCGAGKSTLAQLMSVAYDDCNVFHMDDFFLRPELQTKERLNEVGGNVDYVRFRNEVIKGIQKRMPFTYQIYNCKKKTLEEKILVNPKKINIIEGSYSMHNSLSDFYDLKIFLEIDPIVQKRKDSKKRWRSNVGKICNGMDSKRKSVFSTNENKRKKAIS